MPDISAKSLLSAVDLSAFPNFVFSKNRNKPPTITKDTVNARSISYLSAKFVPLMFSGVEPLIEPNKTEGMSILGIS